MFHCKSIQFHWGHSTFVLVYFPRGEWADPGGSAIPGQPVARTEQAPIPWPSCKNQFNIQVPQWGTFQILSWKEQILHMILAKRPRSDKSFHGRARAYVLKHRISCSWCQMLQWNESTFLDRKWLSVLPTESWDVLWSLLNSHRIVVIGRGPSLTLEASQVIGLWTSTTKGVDIEGARQCWFLPELASIRANEDRAIIHTAAVSTHSMNVVNKRAADTHTPNDRHQVGGFELVSFTMQGDNL